MENEDKTEKKKVAQGWRRKAGKKGAQSRQKTINEVGY